ncbi:MAG: DUF975 family protein [Lentisphaerae bacterium]|nr:DUF975 family protein [Lentisphaerota bacterium]
MLQSLCYIKKVVDSINLSIWSAELMNISFGALFKLANQKLSRNYWRSLLVVLITAGIIQGVNQLSFGLGTFFLMPLVAGELWYFLLIVRGGDPEIDVIFNPFSNYWPLVGANFLASFFSMLPMLLAVPLGIAAVLLGITQYYIAAAVLAVAALLCWIPCIVISLSFFAVNYILLDSPSTPMMDALSRSRALMKNHKLELFGFNLLLMLIGIPVVFLTCGLGLLWYLPFCSYFSAAYYDALVLQNSQRE